MSKINSKFSADLESIVSKLAHKVYSNDFTIINHDDLDEYFMINELEVDAHFILETQMELQQMKDEMLRLAAVVAEDNFRSLIIALYRVLGVSKVLFADKLAAVCDSYVEVASMISKATMCSGEAHGHRAAVEYAVKTMGLMLDQALEETIEYLRRFQDQLK